MSASWIKTWIAAGILTASTAQGEILYQRDGITLEGTVRIENREGAVCQVLPDHHPADVYERMRANHGKPLHVWRLHFAARNGSGRNLEHLTAHFSIASEAPLCTSWSGPLGNYAKPVQWANSFRVLQKPYGMDPDEEVSDTVFVLAFYDQQPKFESWNVDYRFGVAGPAGAASSGRPARGEAGAIITASQLPPEIMADRYLLKAEQAVRDQDFEVARLAMEQLQAVREEHGLEPAPEDHFRYAKAWEAARVPEQAMEAAVRYVQLRGQEAEHYTEALELMNRVESAQTGPADGVSGEGRVAPTVSHLPADVTAEPARSQPSERPQPATIAANAREFVSIPAPDIKPQLPERFGGGARSQTAAPAVDCERWGTDGYFRTATVADVRACLEAGADPHAKERLDWRPLHYAAWHSEDPGIIQVLLAAGANPNATDLVGWTPLHFAASYSEHPEVVEALLAGGANPLAKDASGRTPLQKASKRKRHPEIAQALASATKTGLETRKRSPGPAPCKNWNTERFFEDEGFTIFDGHGKGPAKIVACIEAGYDPMARDGKGSTPLHLAVAYPREKMAEILLGAGADPKARDDDGRTPLHVTSSEPMIEALVAAGADPMARDNDGWTPLHFAAAERYNEPLRRATKALLAVGADLEARDNAGRTPLHLAAGDGVDPEALLAFGPDLEARDAEGRTPLHLAALFLFKSNVKDLLAAGADPMARDNAGRTPLDLAKAFNKEKPGIARVLVSARSTPNKPRGDGQGWGALIAGMTAATVGAASGLDTAEALEVGTRVAGSVLTGQATVAGTGGGGTCLIPGYPRPPGGVANLGFSWCPASVSMQFRAFALQAAGAQCAMATGSSSTPEQLQARHREIQAACGRLAALGVSNCRCPPGLGGPGYSQGASSIDREQE